MRSKATLFLLLSILVAFLLSGCAQNPLAPTLERGTGEQLTAQNGETATFYFTTSQGTFGSFSLFVLFEGSVTSKYLQAVGVCEGEGDVAPTDPEQYSDELPLGFGSYFLMTDGVPHYAKVTVRGIQENSAEQTVTITFDWVLQTEGGNPNLS